MPATVAPNVDVLPTRPGPCEDPDPGVATELPHLRASERDGPDEVDLPVSQQLELLGTETAALLTEAEDQSVEVCLALPVARVADERQCEPAIPARDEERAVSDRCARPGILDPVAPDLFEVLSPQRVLGQDAIEEGAPSGHTRA